MNIPVTGAAGFIGSHSIQTSEVSGPKNLGGLDAYHHSEIRND